MKNEKYEQPTISLIFFQTEDIVRTSDWTEPAPMTIDDGSY